MYLCYFSRNIKSSISDGFGHLYSSLYVGNDIVRYYYTKFRLNIQMVKLSWVRQTTETTMF